MTLQRPELLLFGPAAALLLTFALWTQWRRLGRLGRAYGPIAQIRLVPRQLQPFPTTRTLCLILASFTLAIAAAGPRPITPEAPPPPQPLDLAVAVDVSLSMGAEDVDGSRIERAREVVELLSDGLPSARIVLILFADWPYTLVPPTDDPAVVRYFAHSLSADLVLDRDQGTSFTTALAHAQASLGLRPRAEARRAVLVLSDGGVHEQVGDVIDAAAALSGEGTPVWTAGLGTPEGSAVPTATGPLVDPSGRPVIARLEDDMLREIARAGGGAYHDVSEDRGVEALLEGLGAVGADEQGGSDVPPDATFWLALATIPLILLEGAADAGRSLLRANTQTRSA